MGAQGRSRQEWHGSAGREGDEGQSRHSRWPWIVVTGGVAVALCFTASAQQKELYRYIDANGKVVYTDKAPPPDAKNIQPKRVTANVIDTSEASLTSQRATERFPVTLYTFDCGQPCQSAEALLNKRGVPFKSVNISDPTGNAKVTSLVGSSIAPVLQVGDKMVAKGLDEARWQSMLDDAGYPRAAALRRMAPGTGSEAPPAAKAATSAPAAPSPAAAPPEPAATQAASAAPAPAPGPAPAPAPAPASGGGYPK